MNLRKCALFVLSLSMMAGSAIGAGLDVGGNARSIAMGGAGLALGDRLETTAILNPAAPAASGARTRLVLPGVSFHTEGASVSDLIDSVSDISDASADSAISLVNDFASRPTRLLLTTAFGFAGPFGAVVQGEARGTIDPGTAAAEWATAAASFSSDSAIDLDALASRITNANFQSMIAYANASNYTAAQDALKSYLADISDNHVGADVVYGPQFMLSRSVKRPNGTMHLGATVKLLRGESRSWQVVASEDPNNPVAGTGSNITAGVVFEAVENPVSKKSSVGVDLGMIYKPVKSRWQYGVVINNAIKPGFHGMDGVKEDTTFSVGAAFIPVRGITVAADVINITGANGDSAKLRFGGEMSFGSLLALRAGYSGRNWTYGCRVLGIDLAFEGRTAQLLTNIIKF